MTSAAAREERARRRRTDVRRLQPVVDQEERRPEAGVVEVPERGQGAARAGLDGEAGEAERRPIVALCGIACAQGEEFEGIVTELEQPDELAQPVHRQLVIEGEQEGRLRIAAELTMD